METIDSGRTLIAQLHSWEEWYQTTANPTNDDERSLNKNKLAGSQLEILAGTTVEQLHILLNHLLENEERLPYSFFINDVEVTKDLQTTISENSFSCEETLHIVYQPQAIFRVRSVTRCSDSLEGHTDSVLCVAFSPNGAMLASGSGDSTVRLWDLNTAMPLKTFEGHEGWVLHVSWSPDGGRLVSGGMDKALRSWDIASGKLAGPILRGHTRYITAVSWQPFHRNSECSRLCSASKDCTVKIWDILLGRCLFSLSSHTMSVTCVRWGGEDIIYSGSQDRTIKVWDANDGKLCKTLEGHAHWVNTLALNVDYALRTGPFDHTGKQYTDKQEALKIASDRYSLVLRQSGDYERLISGSDDFTMFLWTPSRQTKPIARLSGHIQLINMVCFSPDGRWLASASFDKSIKLWNAISGSFVATLRGHVEAVYQIAWSADSSLLVSASRDSTLKVWSLQTRSLKFDLPGHADQVYAVDWSPDGERVASGSKDRLVKIWKH